MIRLRWHTPHAYRKLINKEKWYADNKEKQLRYDYDLSPDSVVIDVGGYEGDFVSEIYARYRCKIYVFEPVAKYVNYLSNRFRLNNSVVTIPKGLGAKNETLTIHVMDEASSYNRQESMHKKGFEEKISIIGGVSSHFPSGGSARMVEKIALVVFAVCFSGGLYFVLANRRLAQMFTFTTAEKPDPCIRVGLVIWGLTGLPKLIDTW